MYVTLGYIVGLYTDLNSNVISRWSVIISRFVNKVTQFT